MKNKRANLSCVRTVLLQAGKGHAARTTIKQNHKTKVVGTKTKSKLLSNKNVISLLYVARLEIAFSLKRQ